MAKNALWLIGAVGFVVAAVLLMSNLPLKNRTLHPLPKAVAPISLDALSPGDATYVGLKNCIDCHQTEYKQWLGSDHDLAMDVANDKTVLGNFTDATITVKGVTSRFFKKKGKFYVNTEGPDGKMVDYQITFVFGVRPLQQYLIEFPGGRLQCLPLAWGADPNKNEEDHWFHLYPNEHITPNDVLFWTGISQNWNFMCAECHSTNLQKKYDPKTKTYNTSYAEINVACEACHGPGSKHVQWAWDKEDGKENIKDLYSDTNMGLTISLKNSGGGSWVYDPENNIYKRTKPLKNRVMLDNCARCHARRNLIDEQYVHGKPFYDHHRVELLNQMTYHPDGQILDEDYVYGSFIQSLMFRKGVRCVDCHDPHSLKLLRKGNLLCTHCHTPETYDTPKHHFHDMVEQGKPGTLCIDCHMIERNYMVTDPRRDHSFRIPRPDLSVQIKSPNACNDCHDDQTNQWSVDWVDKWYGKKARPMHYGQAIYAGQNNLPNAQALLLNLVNTPEYPAIARATGYSLLRNMPTQEVVLAAIKSLKDADPAVRINALEIISLLPPAQRWEQAANLLNDPIKAVRIEAVRVLARDSKKLITKEQISGNLVASFDRALKEYKQSQFYNSDRATSWLNLGLIHTELGDTEKAEAHYKKAIDLESRFIPPYINLVDLYRETKQEDKAQVLLQQGITVQQQLDIRNNPSMALLYHSLGLSLVRQQKLSDAVEMFGKATTLDPANSQYCYVYAVSLNSTKQSQKAIDVLKQGLINNPYDQQLLSTLVLFCRDTKQYDQAISYMDQLLKLAPKNQGYQQLYGQLYYLKQIQNQPDE